MNKEEFLNGLGNALAGLPQDEVNERIAFYGEMIDDHIEKRVQAKAMPLRLSDRLRRLHLR